MGREFVKHQLTLTAEQVKAVTATTGELRVCDDSGYLLGFFRRIPFSPGEIAKAERLAKSDGPWYTTQQVLDHLRSLETK